MSQHPKGFEEISSHQQTLRDQRSDCHHEQLSSRNDEKPKHIHSNDKRFTKRTRVLHARQNFDGNKIVRTRFHSHRLYYEVKL